MAAIWIFNSIAKRRRGAGDTFLENGIAVLRAHVEAQGHVVRVIDWATERDYASITPGWLASLNRRIAARLLAGGESARKSALFRLAFGAYLLLQSVEDRILAYRHDRRLRGLAREAAREKVRLFGMKVWFGEAFEWAERLCEHLRRESPETVVIAGGHHPTLYEEDFLQRTAFDLAVISQGERPLARLLALADEMGEAFSRAEFVRRAEALAEAGALKNAVYRQNGRIRKTERYPRLQSGSHPPAYDPDPDKVAIHVLIESLGCSWGDCHFCVHRHLYDGFTPRGVESLLEEMRAMRDRGVGVFRFAGSDTPPDLGAAIGRAILQNDIPVRFGMGSRAVRGIENNKVYARAVEAYATLIRAGLRAVFMGGESGHAWVNEAVMNKGLTPEEVALSARALREAETRTGIKVDLALAMIYPAPTMGRVSHEEVLEANLALIDRVAPDSVMVTPPGPFPHTRWNREAEAYGFRLDPDWIDVFIRYEYVLYKPPFLWPRPPLTFEGRPYLEALDRCGVMRQAVADRGIPTDLSDEHFLMLRAAGFEGRDGAREFKQRTMLDIVSGDYRRIRDIVKRVNARSAAIARAQSRAETVGL